MNRNFKVASNSLHVKCFLLLLAILFACSCSTNPESSESEKIKDAFDSCKLGLCHTKVTFEFGFSQFLGTDQNSKPTQTDSILLSFTYTRYDGTLKNIVTVYKYSDNSKRFSDDFMIQGTSSPIYQIQNVAMAGFNNLIGVRDTVWKSFPNQYISTPGSSNILVSVLNYRFFRRNSVVFEKFEFTKNGSGNLYTPSNDSIVLGDTLYLNVSGKIIPGNYVFSIATNPNYDKTAYYSKLLTVDDTSVASTSGRFSVKLRIPWSNSYAQQTRDFRFILNPAIDGNPFDSSISIKLGISKSVFVKIQGGTFTQGDARSQGTTTDSIRKVTLSDFQISSYPVSAGEYKQVINGGYSPSINDLKYIQLTWLDAAKFCNIKSKLDGLQPAYDTITWALDIKKSGYHIPTSAQWEYAARAGKSTTFWWGDADDATYHASGVLGSGYLNAFGVGGLYITEMTTDNSVKYNSSPLSNPVYQYSSAVGSAFVIRFDNNYRKSIFAYSTASYFRLARF